MDDGTPSATHKPVIVMAGCSVVKSPEQGELILLPDLCLFAKPLSFDVRDGEDFHSAAARRIDELAFSHLRSLGEINRLRTESGGFISRYYYHMIAAVEENNAEFSAFVVNNLPGNPHSVMGYPVHYSPVVGDGEFFGGMWSDGILLLGECREDGDKKGIVFADFRVRHPSAFVLVYEEDDE